MILLITVTSFAQNKEYKEYYDNGKIKITGHTTPDEKETGEWKMYHENGQLVAITNYKDGQLEGEAKEYYENGQLKARGSYIEGIPEGEQKFYYQNGQLKGTYNYVNGEVEGEVRTYYTNGQLQTIGNYKEDILIDNPTYYYENGVEDTRNKELASIFKKYQFGSMGEGQTITKIITEKCYTRVYYTHTGFMAGSYFIEIDHNFKEIDKDGVILYDGPKVKTANKFDDGTWHYVMQDNEFIYFKLKKEDRKEVERLMKSLSKDPSCNE